MSIRLGPQACGTLAEAALREWIVTDGVGGYAMGTVAGLRTRRYHGLLAVALDGPGVRNLGLASLDPVLVAGDARIRLAAHEWGSGVVDPCGHELLASFDLDDGVPRWRWQVGGIVLERELAMTHGGPAVGIVHRLVAADRPVRLELTALCTWRSVHGERHEYGAPGVEQTADGFVFEGAYRVAGAGWHGGGEWYRDVRAREEILELCVVNVGALSIACPRIFNDVLSEEVSSTVNWTVALRIVAPCGILMLPKRRPTV